MKSWRTNLGGAIGVVGSGVIGLAGVTTTMPDVSRGMSIGLFVSGSILCCIGKAVDSLFAPDKAVMEKSLQEHANIIAQLKEDTTQIKQKTGT